MSNPKAVFASLHPELINYYLRWYHEKPIVILPHRQEELRRVQQLLYKCIVHMAAHYMEYVPTYMPLSEKEMQILELQSKYPYRAGTYRPDYLISEDGEILLCEITARFFAHGIFMSYFAEHAADAFAKRNGRPCESGKLNDLLTYMLRITAGKDHIAILKSADKTSEIRLYQPFYEAYGKTVSVITAEDVERTDGAWENSFLISALNQKDLLSFSMDIIQKMIEAGMYNDFRTIFLIHDKRFLHLVFCDAFTRNVLTPEETVFLRAHVIPTYLSDGSAQQQWEDAYQNKDKYILKHYCLGKSEKVYAGVLTEDATWKALWESGAIKEMILQPFLAQKTFRTVWEGKAYADYICGLMLCVDDRYYGSGMFRASSLPVTNQGDDRKAAMLETADTALAAQGDLL